MKGCRSDSCIPEDCPYGDVIVALVLIIYLLIVFVPCFDPKVRHPLRCGWSGIIVFISILFLLCFVCYWTFWVWLILLFAFIITLAMLCYEKRC